MTESRGQGAVARSSAASSAIASCRLAPHMSGPGFSVAQNAGRSGRPNNRQRSAYSATKKPPINPQSATFAHHDHCAWLNGTWE